MFNLSAEAVILIGIMFVLFWILKSSITELKSYFIEQSEDLHYIKTRLGIDKEMEEGMKQMELDRPINEYLGKAFDKKDPSNSGSK